MKWRGDAVSAYPEELLRQPGTFAYLSWRLAVNSAYGKDASTFTGEPGDTYQPERCHHLKDDGCEYCCHKCNFGQHVCPGCGSSIHHQEDACIDCRIAHTCVDCSDESPPGTEYRKNEIVERETNADNSR